MSPEQWILGADTGISSKTIWAVMMGAVTGKERTFMYDVPQDPDDFGRCYRLLLLIRGWRERLPEVAAQFPKWGPMVREWDKLTAMFTEGDLVDEAMFDFMRQLVDEGMEADGWVRESSCSWRRA